MIVLRSNEHSGPEESLPSRTYNISVNHRRQILHTTTRGPHPARWNDKTIVIFDDYIQQIKKGEILSDNEFSLLEYDNEQKIVSQKYKGAWLLCDNGYQNWSCLLAPMKDAVQFKEMRWSKWVESLRKDVKCTFGILKGRFRILKIGIRLHSLASADNLWCTCIALHNFLLEDDGLANGWETGVSSMWEGELGEHSQQDIDNYVVDINSVNTSLDFSGMGFGNDCEMVSTDEDTWYSNDVEDLDAINHNNNHNNNTDTDVVLPATKRIKDMHYQKFRSKLIEHFDISYQQNKIQLPTWNGLVPIPRNISQIE